MRPLWVDRILIEPTLKADLYAFFEARRASEQQTVLDEVRRGKFHEAALATGRTEGLMILYDEVKKCEREDSNANLIQQKKEGGR